MTQERILSAVPIENWNLEIEGLIDTQKEAINSLLENSNIRNETTLRGQVFILHDAFVKRNSGVKISICNLAKILRIEMNTFKNQVKNIGKIPQKIGRPPAFSTENTDLILDYIRAEYGKPGQALTYNEIRAWIDTNLDLCVSAPTLRGHLISVGCKSESLWIPIESTLPQKFLINFMISWYLAIHL